MQKVSKLKFRSRLMPRLQDPITHSELRGEKRIYWPSASVLWHTGRSLSHWKRNHRKVDLSSKPEHDLGLLELATVLDCFSDPAIIVDEEHRIVAANRKFRQNYPGDAPIVGEFCYQVSHNFCGPCEEAGGRCPIQSVRRTGEPSRVVHVHYTARGEEHEEVSTFPLQDKSGHLRFFVEIVRPLRVASAQPAKKRLVGRSQAFNQMLELLHRVSPRDTPVLLLGESGTGKELAAKAIHQLSSRAHGPFVPVDCSGLSESLFESELFGHERGSFTGAFQRKQGLVEAAAGGTLFLDEVGDIPLTLQVKLLRLLESNLFRRVGSVVQNRADFRLICATHRDLQKMMGQELFRKDLYYRLSSFPIRIPPLRERVEDLPLLIESIQKELDCPWGPKVVVPDTIVALESYDFPGNIRELRNILERGCLLADGDRILPEHLPEQPVPKGVPESMSAAFRGKILSLSELESRYLQWAVNHFRGDHAELSRKLGVSERTFYRKLQKIRTESLPDEAT